MQKIDLNYQVTLEISMSSFDIQWSSGLICNVSQFIDDSVRGIGEGPAVRLPLPGVPLPPRRRPLPRQLLHRLHGQPGREQGLRRNPIRRRHHRHRRLGDGEWAEIDITFHHNLCLLY